MKKVLDEYIHKALAAGLSKEEISDHLVQAGWKKQIIDKSLSLYSHIDNKGLVIPTYRSSYEVVQDTFLYIITAITLIASVCSMIFIINGIIDRVCYPNVNYNSMSKSIASLVVCFPLYLAFVNAMNKDLQNNVHKVASLVRKLYIFFILTVTSITGIVDLSALIYNLLEGNYGMSFIIKSLSLLFVMSLIYILHYRESKKEVALS